VRTLLNREFPHQVLILADNVRGRALDSISAFQDDAGVPIKSRSARKDDKWYRLYCFAERRHALSFQLKFGGELLDRPPRAVQVIALNASAGWARNVTADIIALAVIKRAQKEHRVMGGIAQGFVIRTLGPTP
jgi:hypothetical protein